MEHLDLDDASLAQRMGVVRETITRYRNQPHRLNSTDIEQLARILGIAPGDLWRDPTERPSIDAMLHNADPDTYEKIIKVVKVFIDNTA